jgi:low affinity Fe/Cu permease
MKRLVITLGITVVIMATISLMEIRKLENIVSAQEKLLELIYDEDPETWDDFITETDEYQNLIEIHSLEF